jgi:3D (Asp-Asp-Asp) domain-containing protein
MLIHQRPRIRARVALFNAALVGVTALGASVLGCSSSTPATFGPDDAGADSNLPGIGSPDSSTGGQGTSDSSLSSTADASKGGTDATAGGADTSPPSTGEDASQMSGEDASQTYGDANAGGVSVMMEVTQYGWDDNSPPGNAIAYPTIHQTAGGTGTYADPITFATDQDEYPPGTILYVPFMEKYVIMEDDCVQCDSDWSKSMLRHIDVWMNSNGTEDANSLFSCEDSWTKTSTAVITSPPDNLEVTTAPLFDPSTNTCRTTP